MMGDEWAVHKGQRGVVARLSGALTKMYWTINKIDKCIIQLVYNYSGNGQPHITAVNLPLHERQGGD